MLLLKILLILWLQTSLFSQTYTCCNLQDVLWPLIIFSASISVFLLYWIRVYQEVYVFQTRYVLFPLQLLRWSSFSFLHAIRSKFLIYQNFFMLDFISKNWAFLTYFLGMIVLSSYGMLHSPLFLQSIISNGQILMVNSLRIQHFIANSLAT